MQNNNIENRELDHTYITVIITITKLLDMDEAAKNLGIDRTSLKKIILNKEIPCQKIQGKIYLNENDLLCWKYSNSPIWKDILNPSYQIISN